MATKVESMVIEPRDDLRLLAFHVGVKRANDGARCRPGWKPRADNKNLSTGYVSFDPLNNLVSLYY